MPRRTSETLTGRESEIMDVLWDLGAATAEQVARGVERFLARLDRADAAARPRAERVRRARVPGEGLSLPRGGPAAEGAARKCAASWPDSSAARPRTWSSA